ncbi:MAG: cobyrinate a,c-diamide synthase [Kiloniellales bacterium]
MNGVLVSATHKSSGKTIVALGLAAALVRRGASVQTFKKGPDYIDPLWLGRAAGRPCRNLDFRTMSHDEILASFRTHAEGVDLAIVEGNKGLFDGMDVEGTDCNAALARLLGAPVVLVVDTRGMTRGIAPLVKGYESFGENLHIAGIILNQVGGPRHEGKLRAALERYTDVPVLGAVGRHPEAAIAERHLGLVPANEADRADDRIAAIADIIERDVDIERLGVVACGLAPFRGGREPLAAGRVRAQDVRIAIARDPAFGFYYPDDLEALARAGAELVPFDTLHDARLPEADGLFIGGGFPETQSRALARNEAMRRDIRGALEAGMPAYAECGGLMYLCRSLTWQGGRHEMVGFVPGDAVMKDRPVGRGYVRLRETGAGPWPGAKGAGRAFAAHEFHHATLENLPDGLTYAYEVERGHGIDGRRDGLVLGNLLAGFSHQRDTAANRWAERFVGFVRARGFRQGARTIEAAAAAG